MKAKTVSYVGTKKATSERNEEYLTSYSILPLHMNIFNQ